MGKQGACFGKQLPDHPAFPSEACVLPCPSGTALGRSSDLQAAYLLRLPSRICPWLDLNRTSA